MPFAQGNVWLEEGSLRLVHVLTGNHTSIVFVKTKSRPLLLNCVTLLDNA